MRRKSSGATQLDAFNWRVDVKTSSRHSPQINESAAVLEFALSDQQGESTCVRCEADKEAVGSVLRSIEAIQEKISLLT